MQQQQQKTPDFWSQQPIRWKFNNAAEGDWFYRALSKE